MRRFDAQLADLRRAHSWLCERGSLTDALAMSVPNAVSFTGDLPAALEYGRRARDLSVAAGDPDGPWR